MSQKVKQCLSDKPPFSCSFQYFLSLDFCLDKVIATCHSRFFYSDIFFCVLVLNEELNTMPNVFCASVNMRGSERSHTNEHLND